jgi:hypothetical protein
MPDSGITVLQLPLQSAARVQARLPVTAFSILYSMQGSGDAAYMLCMLCCLYLQHYVSKACWYALSARLVLVRPWILDGLSH